MTRISLETYIQWASEDPQSKSLHKLLRLRNMMMLICDPLFALKQFSADLPICSGSKWRKAECENCPFAIVTLSRGSLTMRGRGEESEKQSDFPSPHHSPRNRLGIMVNQYVSAPSSPCYSHSSALSHKNKSAECLWMGTTRKKIAWGFSRQISDLSFWWSVVRADYNKFTARYCALHWLGNSDEAHVDARIN